MGIVKAHIRKTKNGATIVSPHIRKSALPIGTPGEGVPIQKDCKRIYYCECGQAVRYRKRDGIWAHTGWRAMNEPYGDFLERTNHPVKLVGYKDWRLSGRELEKRTE